MNNNFSIYTKKTKFKEGCIYGTKAMETKNDFLKVFEECLDDAIEWREKNFKLISSKKRMGGIEYRPNSVHGETMRIALAMFLERIGEHSTKLTWG